MIITVAAVSATQVAFKNFASFTKCIINMDGTTINDGEDLHLVMLVYYLLEHSSNYSDTTGSLWFYSKDEATDFNADITNNGTLKSFNCKAKSLGNTVEQSNPNQGNGILKNATIAEPLEYLKIFEGHLKCGGLLAKLYWNLYWGSIVFCLSLLLLVIIMLILGTKLYVPVVMSSAKDNQKLSKRLSKRLERSVYWNE